MYMLLIILVMVIWNVNVVYGGPTPQPTTYVTPGITYTQPKTNLTYWCRPIHYNGGPQGSWQRIDSGLLVNATVLVDFIRVWIELEEYNDAVDELGK